MGYRIREGGNEDTDDIIQGLLEKFHIGHTRTDGVHATDTMLCMRKSYWDKISPIWPTPDESLYFLLGLGLQEALAMQEVLGISVNGVIYSLDGLGVDYAPIELKTTRMTAKNLREKGPPKHWLEQLAGYRYAVNQAYGDDGTIGRLIIIPIIKPEIMVFEIDFEPEHILNVGHGIEARGLQLVQAIWTSHVPPKVDAEGRWECKNCRYAVRCAAMGDTTWPEALSPQPWASVREDFSKYRFVADGINADSDEGGY